MYEKIAWSNFVKTGDIESFMEYRRLTQLNSNQNEQVDVPLQGDVLDELNKNQGDSNKRNIL